MKSLLALSLIGLVGLSSNALAGSGSPLVNHTLVCKSDIGTVTVYSLSAVTLDLVAVPPVQPNAVQTTFGVTRDLDYSTNGIQCGIPGSARPGHHIDPCQENEAVDGTDRGTDIGIAIHGDVDNNGVRTGQPYTLQILKAVQTRGGLGQSVSEAAVYSTTFICELK